MAHAESIEFGLEGVGSRGSLGEVAIGNYLQATHASLDEASEGEARDDVGAIVEVNQLRALEAQLEVATHHFLNCLRMTKDVSRFRACFSEEAVKCSSRESTRGILTTHELV